MTSQHEDQACCHNMCFPHILCFESAVLLCPYARGGSKTSPRAKARLGSDLIGAHTNTTTTKRFHLTCCRWPTDLYKFWAADNQPGSLFQTNSHINVVQVGGRHENNTTAYLSLLTHSRVDVVGRRQHVPRPEGLRTGGADQAAAIPAVVPPLQHVAERGVAHGAPARTEEAVRARQ